MKHPFNETGDAEHDHNCVALIIAKLLILLLLLVKLMLLQVRDEANINFRGKPFWPARSHPALSWAP